MSTRAGASGAGFVKETVVWRWKGWRPDIVRIFGAVAEAAGPGPRVFEITDALGTSQFAQLEEFGRALEDVEQFHTVGLIAGAEDGPCCIVVLFDATGTVREAAVTVKTSGSIRGPFSRATSSPRGWSRPERESP